MDTICMKRQILFSEKKCFWCKINNEIPGKTYVYPCPAEPRYAVFANSVDPDQLASEEANWSGPSLFVIKYMNLYQQPGSSNLIGWKSKWAWHLNLFRRSRVKSALEDMVSVAYFVLPGITKPILIHWKIEKWVLGRGMWGGVRMQPCTM